MPRPPTKAQRITEALAAMIAAGELAPGTWLPSERELGRMHEADRATIRRALGWLVDRGLVTRSPGIGFQVRQEPLRRDAASDLLTPTGEWRGFHVSAARAGQDPFTQTTVREVEAEAVLARWLAVPIGTRVLERARVQGIVGQPPTQIATTSILLDVVERLPMLREVNTGPGGMYSRMAEIGIQVRFEETVACRLPSAPEQEALEAGPAQPVLDVWRRGYDQAERIVEVTHRVVVGGRHELVYSYGPTR